MVWGTRCAAQLRMISSIESAGVAGAPDDFSDLENKNSASSVPRDLF